MEHPTAQSIAEFHVLSDEFKALNQRASESIKAAQLHQGSQITIARDGKPVVVTEKDLWDEVYYLGPASDAGRMLAEKYPEPFEFSAQAEAKKTELKKWALEKWGIDPLAISLSDIIKVIEAVVDYRLQKQ
jgi:hypothetical protein